MGVTNRPVRGLALVATAVILGASCSSPHTEGPPRPDKNSAIVYTPIVYIRNSEWRDGGKRWLESGAKPLSNDTPIIVGEFASEPLLATEATDLGYHVGMGRSYAAMKGVDGVIIERGDYGTFVLLEEFDGFPEVIASGSQLRYVFFRLRAAAR